jgi:hypothetical protein
MVCKIGIGLKPKWFKKPPPPPHPKFFLVRLQFLLLISPRVFYLSLASKKIWLTALCPGEGRPKSIELK